MVIVRSPFESQNVKSKENVYVADFPLRYTSFRIHLLFILTSFKFKSINFNLQAASSRLRIWFQRFQVSRLHVNLIFFLSIQDHLKLLYKRNVATRNRFNIRKRNVPVLNACGDIPLKHPTIEKRKEK